MYTAYAINVSIDFGHNLGPKGELEGVKANSSADINHIF